MDGAYMLRQKLLFNLAPLVVLLLGTAVVAVWVMEDFLRELRALNWDVAPVTAHEQLLARFRWVVLGLSIVFLVVINVAVIVLLRLGKLVVRPVDQLIDATKHLAAEQFGYRVTLDQKDEFDDLAKAYNALAEQLQSNERRRLETLSQVALTMNHELNNALAIIELQLTRLQRQAGATPALENCLGEIHQSLQRVTNTVHSLAKIRRIVLTDYVPGTKMLDLERSVEDEQPQRVVGS
jgi:nitrogen fixation/metabolism regulation signal transduction histidine kinase